MDRHQPQELRTEIDMSQSSRITRAASAIGVGGIAVLALFVPSAAFGEPPNAPPGVDVGEAMNGNVNPPQVDIRRLLNDIDTPLLAPPQTETAQVPVSAPTEVLVDDNSIELLQLAIGAAVGTAVGAAGLAVFTARNRRRAAQPQA